MARSAARSSGWSGVPQAPVVFPRRLDQRERLVARHHAGVRLGESDDALGCLGDQQEVLGRADGARGLPGLAVSERRAGKRSD